MSDLPAINKIGDLIAAITKLARSTEGPEHLAHQTAELLAGCTADANWIPDEYCLCKPDSYQARQLYIDPEGAFSICIMLIGECVEPGPRCSPTLPAMMRAKDAASCEATSETCSEPMS